MDYSVSLVWDWIHPFPFLFTCISTLILGAMKDFHEYELQRVRHLGVLPGSSLTSSVGLAATSILEAFEVEVRVQQFYWVLHWFHHTLIVLRDVGPSVSQVLSTTKSFLQQWLQLSRQQQRSLCLGQMAGSWIILLKAICISCLSYICFFGSCPWSMSQGWVQKNADIVDRKTVPNSWMENKIK